MKWCWICLLNVSILHAQVDRYAVVINEIMVDPTPVVGLPNAEYIELRNCSSQPIDLNKWKIEKGTSLYVINSSIVLKPDSLIVLCSKTNLPYFNSNIRTIALSSFPTLTNDEGVIVLKSADNRTMHAVAYQSALHENAIKANGGWSLEMIDPQKPCEANNWTSSIHKNGGTPGMENSVYRKKTIANQMDIIQCVSLNDKTLLLQLNNGMDSNSLSNPINYMFNDTENILQSKPIGPLFNKTEINLKSNLKSNTIYTLQLKNIASCKKEKTFEGLVRTGLLKDPLSNDLLINEILFNPPSDGKDFIEIYNNTAAVINLNELNISSVNALGGWNTSYKVGDGYYNFFPGEYAVLTEDSSFIKTHWPKADSKKIIQLTNLPSMPDDQGNIALLDKQGNTIDKLMYNEKMHYPFIIDPSGVTLERIEWSSASSDVNNWHSASSSSNYGTPTHENSQHNRTDSTTNFFSVSSKIISPNNDGIDDNLLIHYRLNQPGYMCTVYLFGLNGQLISTIINSQLLGTSGTMIWNGLDQQQMLPSGQYIVYMEAFHLHAKSIKEKMLIAIR